MTGVATPSSMGYVGGGGGAPAAMVGGGYGMTPTGPRVAESVPVKTEAPTTYLSAVSGSIYSYLGKSKSTPTPNADSPETMMWASFDYIEFTPVLRHPCLIVGYTTGFQVWDIENLNSVVEICSKREAAVKCAKVLPIPVTPETPGYPLFDARPAIALVMGEKLPYDTERPTTPTAALTRFPCKQLRLFSLKTGQTVKDFSLDDEIYNIYCSKHIFIIALQLKLLLIDPSTFQQIGELPTFPCPANGQVLALSDRWLAYAGNKAIENEEPPMEDKIGKIARDVVKGAYFIGDLAGKSVYSILGYSSETPEEPQGSTAVQTSAGVATAEQQDNSAGGSVVILDIISKKTVSQFYAHPRPLSSLNWDPSGTLLVTADVECRSFHVYRVTSTQEKPQRIYTLHRGVSAAVVQDMAFNDDSRWFIASSTHGTSHIFAVYPSGGPVQIYTHSTAFTPNRSWKHVGFSRTGTYPHIELSALARIHSQDPFLCPKVKFVAASTLKYTQDNPNLPVKHTKPSISAAISTAPQQNSQFDGKPLFLMVTQGVLSLNQIATHLAQTETDKSAIGVATEKLAQWNIARKPSWAPFSGYFPTQEVPFANPKSTWTSNIECITHSTELSRAFWESTKCTFKKFAPDQTTCSETTPTILIETHDPDATDGVSSLVPQARAPIADSIRAAVTAAPLRPNTFGMNDPTTGLEMNPGSATDANQLISPNLANPRGAAQPPGTQNPQLSLQQQLQMSFQLTSQVQLQPTPQVQPTLNNQMQSQIGARRPLSSVPTTLQPLQNFRPQAQQPTQVQVPALTPITTPTNVPPLAQPLSPTPTPAPTQPTPTLAPPSSTPTRNQIPTQAPDQRPSQAQTQLYPTTSPPQPHHTPQPTQSPPQTFSQPQLTPQQQQMMQTRVQAPLQLQRHLQPQPQTNQRDPQPQQLVGNTPQAVSQPQPPERSLPFNTTPSQTAHPVANPSPPLPQGLLPTPQRTVTPTHSSASPTPMATAAAIPAPTTTPATTTFPNTPTTTATNSLSPTLLASQKPQVNLGLQNYLAQRQGGSGANTQQQLTPTLPATRTHSAASTTTHNQQRITDQNGDDSVIFAPQSSPQQPHTAATTATATATTTTPSSTADISVDF
ncbi:Autophagy 18 F [Pelomyxa schiedti]|nr:Autophagy 18 F [Pelomyxa schiedti]